MKTINNWDEIKKLRNLYCTKTAIANYLGYNPSNFFRYIRKKGINLSLPDDKYAFQLSVEKVKRFWNLVNSFENENISMIQLYEKLQKELDIPKKTAREYLKRHNIVKKNKYICIPKIKEIENKDHFNKTEELVISHFGDDLKRLTNYGADFIYKNKLIEVKTSLSKNRISTAILELLYAEDMLNKRFDKKFDKMIFGSKNSKYNSSFRFLRYFDVSLFAYKNGSFKEVDID